MAEPEFFTRAGREFALLDWNPGQEGASAEADDDEEQEEEEMPKVEQKHEKKKKKEKQPVAMPAELSYPSFGEMDDDFDLDHPVAPVPQMQYPFPYYDDPALEDEYGEYIE